MFWGTPALQFVPWRHLAWESIRAGQAPLWNPLVGMGAPLLANYQSGILYPPNWLLFLLDELGGVGWAAWGQSVLVVMHLSWAGIGMYVLGGRLGLGRIARIIGGLAFGLSGYLVARSGFLSINATIAWLPWIVHYSVSYGSKIKIINQHTFKLALCVTLQLLAGHAQSTWYTILLALMWSGIWNWHNSHSHISDERLHGTIKNRFLPILDGLKMILREWSRILLATGAGTLMAAIQLIPTGEYLLQSQRSTAVEYELAMTYSFWPWRLLTLIAPGMFGSPVSGDYRGYGNYWEDAIYVGLLPILLAVSVLLSALRRRFRWPNSHGLGVGLSEGRKYRPTAFLLILIVISFTLAFGDHTPIYPWLYNNLPTIAMFQAPTRFSIWAVFAFALLAQVGVDDWRKPTGRALYWSRLGTAGAFAITIGSGLAWYFLKEVSPSFIRATAMTGLLGVGVGLLNLTALNFEADDLDSPARRNRIWEWCVVTLVMADLLIAHWGIIPGVEQIFFTSGIKNYSLGNKPRLFLPERVEYELKFDRFFRFDTFSIEEDWLNLREVMLPDLNILSEVTSVNNFDPLVPGRYERWMAELNNLAEEKNQAKYEKLLNLMGVGMVVKMEHSAPLGISFHERSGMARLRWVPCSLPVSNDEIAWHLVFNDLVNHELEVVLEFDSQTSNPECPKNTLPESRVEIVSETPHQLSIFTRTAKEGWLVLADVWYPGWYAEVDRQQTPIFRANYLFRAIHLPAGEHQVTFLYNPLSFRLGAWVSLVAWTLFIVAWLRLRRRDG